MAWEKGWVDPAPAKRADRKTASPSSGPDPLGLTAAHVLNQRGFHGDRVYEKSEEPGGLLMFGIPNMKLPKELVQQARIDLFRQEGIEFACGVDVGKDLPVSELDRYDAVLLCRRRGPAARPLRYGQKPDRRSACRSVSRGSDAASALRGATQEKPLRGQARSSSSAAGTRATTALPRPSDWAQVRCHAARDYAARAGDAGRRTIPGRAGRLCLKTDYGQQEAIWLYGRDPRTFEITAVSIIGR